MNAETLVLLMGHRLRELRVEKKLAAPVLAHEMPCTVSNVYAMEAGRYPPSLRNLARLEEILNVDALDFFTWPKNAGLRHEVVELTREAPDEVLAEVKAILEQRLGHRAGEERPTRRPPKIG